MAIRILFSLLLGLTILSPSSAAEDYFSVKVADYVFDFPRPLVDGVPRQTEPGKANLQYSIDNVAYERVGQLRRRLGKPIGEAEERFGYIGLSHPRVLMKITPAETVAERILVNISGRLPITGPGSTVYPRVEVAGTVASSLPVAVLFKRDSGLTLSDSFMLGDGNRWDTHLFCRKLEDRRVLYPLCTISHQAPSQGLVVEFFFRREFRNKTAIFVEEVTSLLREANLRAIRRLGGGCLYDKRDASR